MVLAAAAKALKKAEILKGRMQVIKDLFVDNEPWILQQQLQRLYRRILILDLEYALDKKVEQDLWNHSLKNFIAILQGVAKDKKHPKRTEGQAMLNWCLEAATGFYISLVQEICSVFDLDLTFRRRNAVFGRLSPVPKLPKDCRPSKNSCYYICQHCLVHLGDIARYRNQNRQAEAFYRYAVALSPGSGQPYNQLAILEASRGDKLSAVYHYVRAMALSHPFPAAATNLSRALGRHAEDPIKIAANSKLSSYEYLAAFLKLHGLLHVHSELDAASRLVQALTTSLTAHIATESLSAWKLVQIVAINIFLLDRVKGGDGSEMLDEELTETEKQVQNLITQYIAGCLNAFLLPVYTIKSDDSLVNYFAMPAIKLTLEWIRLQPKVLETSAFQTRLQIWPSLCRLLNQLQSGLEDFPKTKCDHIPLPEDRDLQGFLPLEKTFQGLKFHSDCLRGDSTALNQLRAHRMVNFGSWLAERSDPHLVSASCINASNAIVFEPVGRPEPTGDILKELEELSLGKLSPLLSVENDSTTGASTPDSTGNVSSATKFSQENTTEKRPGILKNEAEKGEIRSGTNRNVRNVALSTIMSQKLTDDAKPVKVTFRTPSPVSKDKSSKASPIHKKQQNNSKPGKINHESKELLQKNMKDKITVFSKGKLNDECKTSMDPLLMQQQKLMEVLTKDDGELREDAKKPVSSGKDLAQNALKGKEKDVQKQQVLSALLNDSKTSEQPQAMSGLLNLSKQQQEMLTNSKQVSIRQQPAQHQQQINTRQSNQNVSGSGQQRVVDKIEAARKEYEAAMSVLQQRKQEQQAELIRFPVEPTIREPFSYERMFAAPPPVPQHVQPPVFVAMNQPVLSMPPPFPFKYQPGMLLSWQEPEQPPMPPASWWTDRPPPPQPALVADGYRDPAGFPQPPPPLNTYSLFSNPVPGDGDANYHLPGRPMQPSFWTGPGPSPLERLLEQQRKQMRDTQPNT